MPMTEAPAKTGRKRILTRDRAYYRMLLALAVPISLQNLITFAVNFADNLMVGQLGDTAVSGVYMGNQIQTFLQLMLTGVVQITGILAAQYWGKRDTKSIRSIVSLSMRVALGLGLFTTVLAVALPKQLIGLLTPDAAVVEAGAEYLTIVAWGFLFYAASQILIAAMRSVESAKIGMYISLVALFVNIGLNAVLIFGLLGFPAMGIRGAAVATSISRVVECAAAAVYVRYADKKLNLRLKDYFNKVFSGLVKDFWRYGLPILAGEVVWAINTITQSGILGHLDSAAVTAYSIMGSMHTLVYIWVTGLSSAVGVITGKTVGSGDVEKVKEYARTTQLLFFGVGIFTCAFILLFRAPFVSLYKKVSPEATAYAMQFIIVLAVSMLGSCYQMPCLAGLVKAGGDVSFVFKNDTLHVFLIVLPAGLLASHFGAAPWIIVHCLKIDQFLKCFVAFVKVNRYKWIKNLTRDNP